MVPLPATSELPNTRLRALDGAWFLSVSCPCNPHRTTSLNIATLKVARGSNRTIAEIGGLLRCVHCAMRPTRLILSDRRARTGTVDPAPDPTFEIEIEIVVTAPSSGSAIQRGL